MQSCFWVFLEIVNYIGSLLEVNSHKFWTLSVANTKAPLFLCETKLKLIQFMLESKDYKIEKLDEKSEADEWLIPLCISVHFVAWKLSALSILWFYCNIQFGNEVFEYCFIYWL